VLTPCVAQRQVLTVLPLLMLLEVAHRELGQHDGSPRAAGLQLNDLELAIDALHGPADTKLPRSEIDVIPAQSEQLAAAKAGSQRQDVQGFEPLTVDHLEQPLSLLRPSHDRRRRRDQRPRMSPPRPSRPQRRSR